MTLCQFRYEAENEMAAVHIYLCLFHSNQISFPDILFSRIPQNSAIIGSKSVVPQTKLQADVRQTKTGWRCNATWSGRRIGTIEVLFPHIAPTQAGSADDNAAPRGVCGPPSDAPSPFLAGEPLPPR